MSGGRGEGGEGELGGEHVALPGLRDVSRVVVCVEEAGE